MQPPGVRSVLNITETTHLLVGEMKAVLIGPAMSPRMANTRAAVPIDRQLATNSFGAFKGMETARASAGAVAG